MSVDMYVDKSGYNLANKYAKEAGEAKAEAKGLLRVARKLGHILKQLDPGNEYLSKKKIDEVYSDTGLDIPSPFNK
jgi:hypothetical protein